MVVVLASSNWAKVLAKFLVGTPRETESGGGGTCCEREGEQIPTPTLISFLVIEALQFSVNHASTQFL